VETEKKKIMKRVRVNDNIPKVREENDKDIEFLFF